MKTSTKVILIVLGILLVLILGLILATPRLVFNFIFGRPSRSTKVPDYYIGTPHYNVSQAGLKIMKELPSEDHYIESRDGLKLHGYLFPTQDEHPKKFVVGVHGYRSYSRPECAPYIQFYRDLGFSMLMVDDRAHAPSEGDYIGFGVLDRLDCVDWCKYLVETYGEDIQIILHGVSMGGATVLSAAGEADLPEQVIGVVGDCGFTSAWDALHFQLHNMAHLPADLILPHVEKLAEKKIGINFHDHSAIEQVKNAKVPILFVQGGKDDMVPAWMAQELYDACGSEHKQLVMVDEAGHGESIAFAPDRYHQAIIELFGLEH